jgi:hypothetical protein
VRCCFTLERRIRDTRPEGTIRSCCFLCSLWDLRYHLQAGVWIVGCSLWLLWKLWILFFFFSEKAKRCMSVCTYTPAQLSPQFGAGLTDTLEPLFALGCGPTSDCTAPDTRISRLLTHHSIAWESKASSRCPAEIYSV